MLALCRFVPLLSFFLIHHVFMVPSIVSLFHWTRAGGSVTRLPAHANPAARVASGHQAHHRLAETAAAGTAAAALPWIDDVTDDDR